MSNIILSLYSKLFSIKNTRYVNHFYLPKTDFSPGIQKITNSKQQQVNDKLNASIVNIQKMVDKYPIIKQIKEVLYLEIKDLDNFKITLIIDGVNVESKIGWDLTQKPTMILPLYQKNIENLLKVTADGDLSLDDVYRFTRVLFIPFLKSLYQADYSNLPKDKSYLELDNFIHVEIKPYKDIVVDGFPSNAQATVVNVDGQWLIFEGLHGDPDIKYEMDISQALKFVYYVRMKILKHAPTMDIKQLLPDIEKYNQLKKEVTVYQRKWHDVSELD